MFKKRDTNNNEDRISGVQQTNYWKPYLTRQAWRSHIENMRDADRELSLNEFFGQIDIFYLGGDEGPDERRNLCTQAMGVVSNGFTRTLQYMLSDDASVYDYEIEIGEFGRIDNPELSFDLGPRAEFYTNAAKIIVPGIGRLRTFKCEIGEGTKVDVLDVKIFDSKPLEFVFEGVREIQAEVLTLKSVTMLWVFRRQFRLFILTDSSKGHKWSCLQWYRKVLSDMALAELEMMDYPMFWKRAVHTKLVRARSQFKKMYNAIVVNIGIVRPLDRPAPSAYYSNRHDDEGLKIQVQEYAKNRTQCFKLWEHFPYTDTRIIIENYIGECENGEDGLFEHSIDHITTVLLNHLRDYSAEIENFEDISLSSSDNEAYREIPEVMVEKQPEVKVCNENQNAGVITLASSELMVELNITEGDGVTIRNITGSKLLNYSNRFGDKVNELGPQNLDNSKDTSYTAKIPNNLTEYQSILSCTVSVSQNRSPASPGAGVSDQTPDYNNLSDTPVIRQTSFEPNLFETNFNIVKKEEKVKIIPIHSDVNVMGDGSKNYDNAKLVGINFYESIPEVDPRRDNNGPELFDKHFQEYPQVHGQTTSPRNNLVIQNAGSSTGVAQESESGNKMLDLHYDPLGPSKANGDGTETE